MDRELPAAGRVQHGCVDDLCASLAGPRADAERLVLGGTWPDSGGSLLASLIEGARS